MKPYEEIVEFIAEAAATEKLAAFRPSNAAERRVADLLNRQQNCSISAKESEALQLFVQLDHVMGLAKAKATPVTAPLRRERIGVSAVATAHYPAGERTV